LSIFLPEFRRRRATTASCGRVDDFLFPGHYELQRVHGPVAQLGEHLVCNQGVRGSSPLRSTNHFSNLMVGCSKWPRGIGLMRTGGRRNLERAADYSFAKERVGSSLKVKKGSSRMRFRDSRTRRWAE
jgi:hypothetical protein